MPRNLAKEISLSRPVFKGLDWKPLQSACLCGDSGENEEAALCLSLRLNFGSGLQQAGVLNISLSPVALMRKISDEKWGKARKGVISGILHSCTRRIHLSLSLAAAQGERAHALTCGTAACHGE